MFNGIPQYSTVKHFAVTDAHLVEQICKIRPSNLKWSQETTWNRLWELENKVQKSTFAITWSPYRSSGHVPRLNNQWWFPATITKLCKEPRSYIITTKDGVKCRKTQAHLKPYQPQVKKTEDEHLSQTNHTLTVKSLNTKSHKIYNLAQSRPKRDMKPPIKLDL